MFSLTLPFDDRRIVLSSVPLYGHRRHVSVIFITVKMNSYKNYFVISNKLIFMYTKKGV